MFLMSISYTFAQDLTLVRLRRGDWGPVDRSFSAFLNFSQGKEQNFVFESRGEGGDSFSGTFEIEENRVILIDGEEGGQGYRTLFQQMFSGSQRAVLELQNDAKSLVIYTYCHIISSSFIVNSVVKQIVF